MQNEVGWVFLERDSGILFNNNFMDYLVTCLSNLTGFLWFCMGKFLRKSSIESEAIVTLKYRFQMICVLVSDYIPCL